MYTSKNFKTKKALKDAVVSGHKITIFQPGPFQESTNTTDGLVYLEGPHYPEPHRWYAQAVIKDGFIVRIEK